MFWIPLVILFLIVWTVGSCLYFLDNVGNNAYTKRKDAAILLAPARFIVWLIKFIW